MNYLAASTVYWLLFLLIIASAHQQHHDDHLSGHRDLQPLTRCSTQDPTDEDRHEQQRALSLYQTDQHSSKRLRSGQLIGFEAKSITIPVCFHLIQKEDGVTKYTDDDMQTQLDHLNHAFSSEHCCDEALEWCEPGNCSVETGVRFQWAVVNDIDHIDDSSQTVPNIHDPNACFFRVSKDRWSLVREKDNYLAKQMKRSLRRGDARVLNVYFTTLEGFLGYAKYPWEYSWSPGLDGVVIDPRTMKGGEIDRYSEGDTLVHEVGHWLGLLHTFAGGCGISDGAFDTAREAYPYIGCGGEDRPLDRDTCPGDDAPDPLHNFLDYSDDACLFSFTPGQTQLMHANYEIFRLNNRAVIEPTPLTKSVSSDPIFLPPYQRKMYSIQSSDDVVCTAVVDEGKLEISFNWEEPVTFSDADFKKCEITASTMAETDCRAEYWWEPLVNVFPTGKFTRSKTLYVGVRAASAAGVYNLKVTCM